MIYMNGHIRGGRGVKSRGIHLYLSKQNSSHIQNTMIRDSLSLVQRLLAQDAFAVFVAGGAKGRDEMRDGKVARFRFHSRSPSAKVRESGKREVLLPYCVLLL